MSESLTKGIVKRIFANIGVVSGRHFGKAGITEAELLNNRKLTVRYEDKDINHDIYSGAMAIGESEIRAVLIDLNIDDLQEYLFVFRMDVMPIHSLRVILNPGYDEMVFVRLYDPENDRWADANMYMKAMMLASFEQITSWGILWDKCDNIKDLYDAAIGLVNS